MTKKQKSVEKASSQDLSSLHYLFSRANEYSLQLSKRKAWENVEKAHNAIKKELLHGNVFIIRNNDTITSSITLSETNDEWNTNGNDGKALYIKKFMKDADKARPDEGLTLLKFAVQEAEKRKKIILDVMQLVIMLV